MDDGRPGVRSTTAVGPGRSSFAWYRLRVALPARVGDLDVAGLSAVFEIVVDDYAEVWVNGGCRAASASRAARSSPASTRRTASSSPATPGRARRSSIAVFAANGPLSDPPSNYIWVRSATLDFYRPRPGVRDVPAEIERRGRAARRPSLPAKPAFERLADGIPVHRGPGLGAGEQAAALLRPERQHIYRWTR